MVMRERKGEEGKGKSEMKTEIHAKTLLFTCVPTLAPLAASVISNPLFSDSLSVQVSADIQAGPSIPCENQRLRR